MIYSAWYACDVETAQPLHVTHLPLNALLLSDTRISFSDRQLLILQAKIEYIQCNYDTIV